MTSDLFEKLRRLPLPAITGLDLRQAGHEWKALCPFHEEKTPSFTIFEKDGWHWKCFGCGKGGDVVDFVALRRGLSTIDAARALAVENGIPIPEPRPPSPAEAEAREKEKAAAEAAKVRRSEILRALSAATDYYRKAYLLDRPEPARARAYVEDRGLGPARDEWGLGYAPDSDGILRYLDEHEVGADLRIEAGITAAGRGGGEYRRFRDRLMIPIRDPEGQTVSFVGRIIPGGEGG